MQKKIIIILIILISSSASVWFFGLFPVTRVNGDYILYRTYNGRVNALERFETKNRIVAGNASLTPAERKEIRKFILQNLIMEHVFWQYTEEHAAFSDIKESADAVVASTLKEADPNILPQATKEVYGWSIDEFKENILFPQAFQNQLREAIERDGISFDEFARTQITNAQVRVYAVPWKWENGGLMEK